MMARSPSKLNTVKYDDKIRFIEREIRQLYILHNVGKKTAEYESWLGHYNSL